jgi:flavin-dependent dehydrogenase
LHLFDGGYAGFGPVEGGRSNLGMIVNLSTLRSCDGSPTRLLERRLKASPYLREALGHARPCSGWKGVGPLRFGLRRATVGGALFIGDAAGTVDPFCGEGMSNALCGAELALPFALQAVEKGSLTDDLAGGYESAWRNAFAPVTRRVRWLGRLLERPRLARPVLRLLGGPARRIAPRLMSATRTGGST